MGSIDDFAMWHKLDQYASFSILKDSARGFTGRVNYLPLILLGNVVQYHSMLCHIVLKSKLFSQPFPIVMLWQKLSLWWHIIAAVRGRLFCWSFVLFCQQMRNPVCTNFLVSQTFHRLLNHTAPYYILCCHLRVTHQFSLMRSSIFHLFILVEAVHRWADWCLCSHL